MNCQRVQQLMAAWHGGRLEGGECAACEAHCAACPSCHREWESFQAKLLVVLVPCQPLPTSEVSRQMWSACSEKIFLGIEARRTPTGWELTRHWARCQPVWGWVALGSAILIFSGVWWLAPVGDVPVNVASGTVEAGPVMMIGQPQSPAPADSNAIRVEFSSPPPSTESVTSYHSAMPFDPFADRVGANAMPAPGR